MKSETLTPLRLGLLVMLSVLVLGTLAFRFQPSRYKMPLETSAEVSGEQSGIAPADFWKEMETPSSDRILVDIRSTGQYKAGHIKEAVRMPEKEILLRRNLKELRSKTVFIYSDKEPTSHRAATLLTMVGVNASAVNSNYKHLTAVQKGPRKPSAMFFSEEKARYQYQDYFKALKITPAAPIEVKVPVPKPGGC